MADKPISLQKLVNADKDADTLEQVTSADKYTTIVSRLGRQYPSLAKALQTIIDAGGFKPYSTEAELKASVPVIVPSAAYAFDTKKVWLWNGSAWIDEGTSALDQAKSYADANPLFKPGKITTGTDYNNFVVSGFYQCVSSEIAQASANCPTQFGNVLWVMSVNDLYQMQVVFDNKNNIYMRSETAPTTWETVWTKITTGDNIAVDAAQQLIKTIDSNANLLTFTDSDGGFYIPLLSDSVQSILSKLRDRIVGLDKEARSLKSDLNNLKNNNPISKDSLAAISVLTDAQNKTLEILDENAKRWTDGTSNLSLDEKLLKLQSDILALKKKGLIFDVVRDFGIKNDGKTPVGSLLHQISWWIYRNFGGGVLYFDGDFLIEQRICPPNNVHWIGAGWGNSRFIPLARTPVFYSEATSTYLENALFKDFEIEGENHISYSVQDKGFFFRSFRNCFFLRNYIRNTGATGMGSDFADGSYILDGRYENCGRLGNPGSMGSSGIGVGTGELLDEPLLIANNVCIGNKNFGIFCELQRDSISYQRSRQTIINANICTGNSFGIGDCGVDGLIITNNQLNDNNYHGFVADTGTLDPIANRPVAGGNGLFANNQVLRNKGSAILYDAHNADSYGAYKFSDNQIKNNTGHAFEIFSGTRSIPDLVIQNNDIIENAGNAVNIASGTLTDLDILNNRMLRNTGAAIKIEAEIKGGSVFGNRVRDTRSTKTQTAMLTGAGKITGVDVSENHYVGLNASSAINLTNTQNSITYGRNPATEG